MPVKYIPIFLLTCVLSINNACAPKLSIVQEDSYGCILPPSSVFTSNKIDINIAETIFKNISVGSLSVKDYPEVISLMNEAAQNNAVRNFYRCLAKKRDGWNDEQLAWQDGMIFFSQSNPTPEELAKFLKENPFPISFQKEGLHPIDKDTLGRKQHHVKPEISCSMENPTKFENDKYFRDKRNPNIIVRNNGPIKAVSVSCDIKIYDYNLAQNKIVAYVETGFRSFAQAFFAQELKPFDELRRSTLVTKGKNILGIYVVKVNYHRESDMKPFSLQKYFFIENGKIIENSEFKKDERYDRVIGKLKAYKSPETDALSIKVAGAENDVWFMEADNWLSAKRDFDGIIKVVGLGIEQEETPQDGYPYLDIKPKPFKATGFYTEAQIVEDHIEVKIQFAVKNTGDATAIITEDGDTPIVMIEPNQTKYYAKTIIVYKKKDNLQPLKNIINSIDNEDVVFKLKFSIRYRPGNDNKKLFKSTIHCKIRKNKVISI
jgi:hypothetical protein